MGDEEYPLCRPLCPCVRCLEAAISLISVHKSNNHMKAGLQIILHGRPQTRAETRPFSTWQYSVWIYGWLSCGDNYMTMKLLHWIQLDSKA